MSGKVQLVVPVGHARVVARQVAPRLPSLQGKSIGFLENSKHNAALLFSMLAERVQAEQHVGAVVLRSKNNSSIAAPHEVLAELAERCDVVITGTGD